MESKNELAYYDQISLEKSYYSEKYSYQPIFSTKSLKIIIPRGFPGERKFSPGITHSPGNLNSGEYLSTSTERSEVKRGEARYKIEGRMKAGKWIFAEINNFNTEL